MSDPTASFLDSLKANLPKWTSVVISGAFFGATLLINVTANKTHIADEQRQQEKRITTLEDTLKNDVATRRELQNFKGDATERLNRIEDKLDKELAFHQSK